MLHVPWVNCWAPGMQHSYQLVDCLWWLKWKGFSPLTSSTEALCSSWRSCSRENQLWIVGKLYCCLLERTWFIYMFWFPLGMVCTIRRIRKTDNSEGRVCILPGVFLLLNSQKPSSILLCLYFNAKQSLFKILVANVLLYCCCTIVCKVVIKYCGYKSLREPRHIFTGLFCSVFLFIGYQ